MLERLLSISQMQYLIGRKTEIKIAQAKHIVLYQLYVLIEEHVGGKNYFGLL